VERVQRQFPALLRFQRFEDPIAALEHRDAIRKQAFGSAYTTKRLGVTIGHEVHLDRWLERILAVPAGGLKVFTGGLSVIERFRSGLVDMSKI
jgi:hypothetical protein